MKPPYPPLLLLFVIALLAGDLIPAPVPSADRSADLRRKVEALLGPRRRREALPLDPPNPFTLASGGVAVAAAGDGRNPVGSSLREPSVAPSEASSAEILARVASRLRIGGLIRLKDHMQIVINESPWREGDSLMVEREPRPIQVQVVRIQPGQLILRLDEAELVIRF